MKNKRIIRVLLFVAMAAVPARSFPQDRTERSETELSTGNRSVGIADSSMVFVRGGKIQVGIDLDEIPRFEKIFEIYSSDLFKDEVPRHWVSVGDFYLDKNLVTSANFKKFTDANPEWQPGHVSSELDNGNYLKHWAVADSLLKKGDHPVVNVNWYAAMAYCRWEGKRLPTESEWEYAARGGGDGMFPWGNEMPDRTRANFAGTEGGTSAVGKYPANRYGLFDMAGNVWQFLEDEWGPYPSSRPTPQKSPAVGEKHFLEGTDFLQIRSRRVIRGGSYEGAAVNLWVEYRDSHPPNGSREFVGFRCAK